MGESNKSESSLKPDVVMKNYLRSAERFADLINGVCFGGKQIVRPEELVDEDTDQSYLTETTATNGQTEVQSVQMTRDSIRAQVKVAGEADIGQADNDEAVAYENAQIIRKMVRNLGVQIVLWSVEPQIFIDYAMPLRIMGYDYGTYRKEFKRNAEKFTKEWMEENHIVGDERLSKMRKTDKLSPVITICLYLGEAEWDGSRSLKEMLDIPEEVRDLVNDYPIHFVDARRDASKLVFHDDQNQDLFTLLSIISDKSVPIAERRRKWKSYGESRHVAPEVARAVYSITRRKGLPVDSGLDEEDFGMDELIRYIMDEGEAEGEKRGEKKGQMDVIQWMIENPGATPEQAMQVFGFSEA